ncbi:MAG: hypothetical protein QM661_07790 [Solimonas sp.]
MREAATLRARAFGERDPRTLLTRYQLVRSLAYTGTAEAFAEAADVLERTDAAAATVLRAPTSLALSSALARAEYHFQRLQIEPALDALARADAAQRQAAPDDDYETFRIRYMIADGTLRLGRLEESAAQAQALLDGPLARSPQIGVTMRANLQVVLARALRGLGRYDEALRQAQDAADALAALGDETAYATILALSAVASIHQQAGHCALALPVQRTVHERSQRRNGADAKPTLYELGNLGLMEYDCGSRETGIRLVADVEHGLRENFGTDEPAAQSFRYFLVNAKTEAGEHAAALDLLDGLDARLIAMAESTSGWEHRLAATRGLILVRMSRAAEGRELLRPAIDALTRQGGNAEELRKYRAAAAPGPVS